MSVSKTVALGISGGVDSSVAAYLLKKMGYNVIGIFLELGHPMPKHLPLVMEKLGITWIKMPLTISFSKTVIEKTLQMYKEGYTPNPCTICNRDAKMKGLYEAMKNLGADYMATGHYSQVAHKTPYGNALLKKDSDNPKDQTYFLALIDRNIVKHLIFPLNGMKKEEIYAIAEDIGILPLIGKKESQDICFSKKMSDFLKHHLGEKSGKVVLYPENIVVGHHRGTHLYTVGEKLGAHPKTHERLYVIKKKDNTLYVAPKTYLLKTTVKLFDINMFVDNLPPKGLLLETRYRGPLAEIKYIDGNIVKLENGIQATPGQIGAVFDREGHLLMGGIIEGGDNLENI